MIRENHGTTVYPKPLFKYLSYLSGAYGSATFTDSETETYINSNRIDKVNCNSNIITWHHHFCSFRKCNLTSYIKRSNVELRTVFIMEGSVSSTFFFLK